MAKSDEALLQEAKDRYKLCEEAWSDNRKMWLEDTKFLKKLEQWPEEIKRQRSKPGKERPCLTVDKLNQYHRQVVNDGRQNRPQVKVRAVDGAADVKAAEAFQKRVRAIWQRGGDQAVDTALDHAVTGGFGFMRLITEYASERSFNQELRIKRIRNPLSVMLDPMAQEADGSDARYGFVTDDVPTEDFKAKWPKAKSADFKTDSVEYGEGWLSEHTVRVCEYFYREEKTQNVMQLDTGAVMTEEDYWKQFTAVERPGVVQTRAIPSWSVKWCRMTGVEILEKNEWLGIYIPIIPVYGNEADVEGKVVYSGLIRAAKDAQRLYNYARSAFAERVALVPKAPWLTEAESVEEFADEWDTANTDNHARLRYRAYNEAGQQLPPPQRVDPTDVPLGFSKDMEHSEHDIQAALGMYSASLGQQGNEKSGKAIMARQREGDTATFHFQDNLNRAIGYLGRQLVDLIPKIEDNKRSVSLIDEDGTATVATINPEQDQAVMENGDDTSFNFKIGRYEVVTEAGPSYTTKRIEAAEAMMQLSQAMPEFVKVAGDIMVSNMDWPGADKIAERLKKMLPPELQDEEEGESPEVAAVKAQAKQIIDDLVMQMEEARAAAQELAAENAKLEQQVANKQGEVAVKAMDAETGQYEAETQRMQALAPAITPEFIQQLVQQTVAEIMNQPVPQPPPPQAAPPQPGPEPGFFSPEGVQ